MALRALARRVLPASFAAVRRAAYTSRVFASIEPNGPFYSLQDPKTYEAWYEDTPREFQFAVKGPRFIPHMKRLRGVRRLLANFLASSVLALRDGRVGAAGSGIFG